MAGVFSYSGNPNTNPKDAVRFLIGDTDSTQPLLMDGEITYFLTQYNNTPLNAAIQCCESIAAKFTRMSDEKVGTVDVKFSQKAKQYTAMRDTLRQRLALNDATPYAGGISQADKHANDANADRVNPAFTKNMMENHQDSSFVPQSDINGSPLDQGA